MLSPPWPVPVKQMLLQLHANNTKKHHQLFSLPVGSPPWAIKFGTTL